MAIKEVLELVGSDVVIKQLDAVQKKGEESLATFNKPLPELKFPEIKLPDAKAVEDFAGRQLRRPTQSLLDQSVGASDAGAAANVSQLSQRNTFNCFVPDS
jgi:hypothetical protein